MSRSAQWPAVARLVEESQRRCEAFDPDHDDPRRCLSDGIEPIVALYIDSRRTADETLSPVEQSLLERALNDWLAQYAASHQLPFHAHFTVHEMAVAYATDGELEATVDDLLRQ
jgi:hypothetical protein